MNGRGDGCAGRRIRQARRQLIPDFDLVAAPPGVVILVQDLVASGECRMFVWVGQVQRRIASLQVV